MLTPMLLQREEKMDGGAIVASVAAEEDDLEMIGEDWLRGLRRGVARGECNPGFSENFYS